MDKDVFKKRNKVYSNNGNDNNNLNSLENTEVPTGLLRQYSLKPNSKNNMVIFKRPKGILPQIYWFSLIYTYLRKITTKYSYIIHMLNNL